MYSTSRPFDNIHFSYIMNSARCISNISGLVPFFHLHYKRQGLDKYKLIDLADASVNNFEFNAAQYPLGPAISSMSFHPTSFVHPRWSFSYSICLQRCHISQCLPASAGCGTTRFPKLFLAIIWWTTADSFGSRRSVILYAIGRMANGMTDSRFIRI